MMTTDLRPTGYNVAPANTKTNVLLSQSMKTSPSPQFGQTISLRTLTLGSIASLGIGIATAISGWIQYGGYSTHPTETAIVNKIEHANKKTGRSILFDAASSGLKNGITRFWSGDMASDKTKAVQAFKIGRNAEKTLQDNTDPLLTTIATNTEAQEIISGNISRIRDQRDAYYELTQKTIELAHDNPKSTIGKWMKDYRSSRLQEDLKSLDAYDQQTVGQLYLNVTDSKNGSPVERAEKFYTDYVNLVVKKHQPDQAEACLNAGKQVFQAIQDQHSKNKSHLFRDLLALALALPGGLGLFFALNAASPNPDQYRKD
jgi:hypothetical protein